MPRPLARSHQHSAPSHRLLCGYSSSVTNILLMYRSAALGLLLAGCAAIPAAPPRTPSVVIAGAEYKDPNPFSRLLPRGGIGTFEESYTSAPPADDPRRQWEDFIRQQEELLRLQQRLLPGREDPRGRDYVPGK